MIPTIYSIFLTFILTTTAQMILIVVMPVIETQYGNPMTVLSATQGVNTVTPKFNIFLMM